MKIEEGKTYRDVAGRKVGPMQPECDEDYMAVHPDYGFTVSWRPNGIRYKSEPGMDLISEWTEPAQEQGVTYDWDKMKFDRDASSIAYAFYWKYTPHGFDFWDKNQHTDLGRATFAAMRDQYDREHAQEGTLQELDVKEGDVVTPVEAYDWWTVGKEYTVEYGGMVESDSYGAWLHAPDCTFRLISRAPVATDGPVRTVTRKEIVPGVYGAVRIQRADDGLDIAARLHSDDLDGITAAIETLTAVRDAMESTQ